MLRVRANHALHSNAVDCPAISASASENIPLGLITLGGGYPADAPAGLTFQSLSRADFSISAGALAGADVKVMLLDTQSSGDGFSSLNLEIDDQSQGAPSALLNQTFVSLAAARAYFADHVIDLIPGVNQSGFYSLSVILTVSSDHASSFEADLGMAGPSAVPEPGSIGFMAIVVPPVLLRRRKSRPGR